MPAEPMPPTRNPSRDRRRRLATGLLVGVLLVASRGWAGSEDPEDLIRQGVALRKRGEEAKAHGYFQRAYEIAHTPRTAAQLGLSKLATGSFLDAELLLSQALETTDPWVAEHKSDLESGRVKARGRLGRIQIEGAPPDATIAVGRSPAVPVANDGAVWVAPGTVHLKLQAVGYTTIEQDETIEAGAAYPLRMVVARMAPTGEAAPPQNTTGGPANLAGVPPASPRPGGSDVGRGNLGAGDDGPNAASGSGSGWRGPAFWGSTAGAVALLGFGVYETLQHRSTLIDFNDGRRMPACGQTGSKVAGGPVCVGLAADLDRSQALAIVGFVGGGLLALTAIVLKATEPRARPTTSETSARSAGGRSFAVSCAPWLAVSGGASCSLLF